MAELGGGPEPAVDEEHGDAEQEARFGRFALCRDDQGSTFGLHEPSADPRLARGGDRPRAGRRSHCGAAARARKNSTIPGIWARW